MIRRILGALEEGRRRTLLRGLDGRAEVAWSLSGEQILARVGAWQALLHARGVGVSDRVAIDLSRGPELLPAHVAVLAAGATVVPINPALPPGERKRVVARADLRTLLEDSDTPEEHGPVALTEAPAASPALLIFTSGTTGDPKGVPLTQGNLESNLAALTETWGLSSSDRLLHVLPAHHVHGLVLALYGSARLGIPILLDSRFDADRSLDALAHRDVTVFMGVPTMYHRMIASPMSVDLSKVRVFISGSAPLTPRDFRAFESRFGHRPVERYGLSETLIVSSNPLHEERRPGTVGLPLPGTEIRLAQDGEIELRAASVMSGYWRAPDISQTVFRDGFFQTGDLGRLDESGYLVVTGRKKELILVGGSNVLPGEVEHVLSDEAGVEELAVAGLPDADLGEIVGAFIVLRPDETSGVVEERLRDRAERDLAPYKRPRLYRFVTALPRNAMGKIDRRALVDV
jgi:malonyl-CoA/methylmalonyl-CoA synthetase